MTLLTSPQVTTSLSVMPSNHLQRFVQRVRVPPLSWIRRLLPRQWYIPDQVDTLPPELVLQILSYLMADFHEAQAYLVHYQSTGQDYIERKKYSSEGELRAAAHRRAIIATARQPFYSLSLVSKSWNQACAPFLYAQPFLFHYKQLCLFRKTISKRSDLASLVQHPVVLFTQVSQREYGLRDPMNSYRLIHKAERQRAKSFEEFAKIRTLCTELRSFTVETPSHAMRSRFSNTGLELFREDPTMVGVRNLRIIGYELHVRPSMPGCFEKLEVLCLNSILLSCRGEAEVSMFEFPTLPNVHRLHIANSDIRISTRPRRTLLTKAKFPQLRSLVLQNNAIQLNTLHDIVLEFELESLALVGQQETLFLDDVVTNGGITNGGMDYYTGATFNSVKHLSFNYTPLGHTDDMRLALMNKLESCTFHMDVADIVDFSEDLATFFERNLEQISSGESSLRRMDFLITEETVARYQSVDDLYTDLDFDEYKHAVQCVRSLCKTSNIEHTWNVMRFTKWCTHACF